MRIGDAPGLSGPPDEDDRVAVYVEELLEAWALDDDKQAAARDAVIEDAGLDEYELGQIPNFEALVEAKLREWAELRAESESKNWIPWSQAQRQRNRGSW